MGKWKIPERMAIASIWVVWAFLATGALGWALMVVVAAVGMKDAPTWVQAIGSVGAILVAIWISERGHRRDREKAERDANDERSRLIGLAERAVHEAEVAIDMLTDDMHSFLILARTEIKMGRLDQAATILRGLLLQPLPQLVASDVFAVLAHIAELKAAVSSWNPMQVPSGWKQIIGAHHGEVKRRYSSIAAQYRLHEASA